MVLSKVYTLLAKYRDELAGSRDTSPFLLQFSSAVPLLTKFANVSAPILEHFVFSNKSKSILARFFDSTTDCFSGTKWLPDAKAEAELVDRSAFSAQASKWQHHPSFFRWQQWRIFPTAAGELLSGSDLAARPIFLPVSAEVWPILFASPKLGFQSPVVPV